MRRTEAGRRLARPAERGIFDAMADPEKEQPVMLPFADKAGSGWHVIVRYHQATSAASTVLPPSKRLWSGLSPIPERSISSRWEGRGSFEYGSPD